MIDLKEERTKKNMTQEDLAERCNVIRQTISNIELGLAKPSVKLAKSIGDVLGIDWTKFFDE